MRLKKLLTIVTVFGFLAAPAVAAKPRKPAKKTVVSASRKPGVKPKASKTARRGKGKKVSTVAARKPSSPKQLSPTPERYVEIQQALAERGYLTTPPTGVWGPECVDALKRFQADQNLSPDGKLGALSLIALGLGPKRDLSTALAGKPDGSTRQ